MRALDVGVSAADESAQGAPAAESAPAQGPGTPSACVVVDNLSPLLLHHPARHVRLSKLSKGSREGWHQACQAVAAPSALLGSAKCHGRRRICALLCAGGRRCWRLWSS